MGRLDVGRWGRWDVGRWGRLDVGAWGCNPSRPNGIVHLTVSIFSTLSGGRESKGDNPTRVFHISMGPNSKKLFKIFWGFRPVEIVGNTLQQELLFNTSATPGPSPGIIAGIFRTPSRSVFANHFEWLSSGRRCVSRIFRCA